ncbi:conserved hypothetical protein [Neospora caninum Liverpool]|uniref:Uncharacterized protein n=1 Tax=Neospora caninum (strain Liverpool) TaxID=572307 RepID=F0VIC6_NEOCL|nr:conserved hypothetical protein [Neospora caninum Liverpool]CBZ53487.1 conserved hypothetical protein [Neospora caninum Liverpool]CEL67475.1 TPA: hypothetical protein BN1204_032740 [Neospora caninum Liverpool]|eukprot:XP_003883519.1 conserved hypothetical protein [Neospora caninum Liverpool]
MADSGPVGSADRPSAASAQGTTRNLTATREGSSSSRSSTLSSSASTSSDGSAVSGSAVRTDGKSSGSPGASATTAGSAMGPSSPSSGKKAGSGEALQKGNSKGSSGGKHGSSSKGTGGSGPSWKNGTSHSSKTASGSQGSTGQGNPKNSSGSQSHKHGNDSSHGGNSSSAKKDLGGFDSELSARELRKIKYYEEMFARLANEERQKQSGTPSSSSSGATGTSSASGGSSEKQSKKGGPHRGDGSGGASSKASGGTGRSEGSTDSQDTQVERTSQAASPGPPQQPASQSSGAGSASRGSGGAGTKRKHSRVIDSTDDEGPPTSPPRASNKRPAVGKGGAASEPVAAFQTSGPGCSGGPSRALPTSGAGGSDSQRKAEKPVSRYQPGGPAADACRGAAAKTAGKSESSAGPRQASKDATSSSTSTKPSPLPHASGAAPSKGHSHPPVSGSGSAAPPSRSGFRGESDWGWAGRGNGGEASKKKPRAAVPVASARDDEEDSSSSSSSGSSGSSSSSSSGSSDSSEGEGGAPRSKISRSKDGLSRSDAAGGGSLANSRGKRLAVAAQPRKRQASFGSGGSGGATDVPRRGDASGVSVSASKSDKKGASASAVSQHQGGEGPKKPPNARLSSSGTAGSGASASGWASGSGKSAPPHQRPSSGSVSDEKSGADSWDDSTSRAGNPTGVDSSTGGGAKAEKKASTDDMRRKPHGSNGSGRSLVTSTKGAPGSIAGTGDASHLRAASDLHGGEAEGLRPGGCRVLVKGEKHERAGNGPRTGSVKQEKDGQAGGLAAVGGRVGDGVAAQAFHEKNPWEVEGSAGAERGSCVRDLPVEGAVGLDSRVPGSTFEASNRRGPSPLGKDTRSGPCPPGDSRKKAAEEGGSAASRSRSASPSAAAGADVGGSKGEGGLAGSGEKGGRDSLASSHAKESLGRAEAGLKGAAGGATAPGRQTAGKRGNTGRGGSFGAGVAGKSPAQEPGREGQASSPVAVPRGGSELAGVSQPSATRADSDVTQSRASQGAAAPFGKRAHGPRGSGESVAAEMDMAGRGKGEAEKAHASGNGRSPVALSSSRGARRRTDESVEAVRSGVVSEGSASEAESGVRVSGAAETVERPVSASGGGGTADKAMRFGQPPGSSDSPTVSVCPPRGGHHPARLQPVQSNTQQAWSGAGGGAGASCSRGPKPPAPAAARLLSDGSPACRVSPSRLQGLQRQVAAFGTEAGDDEGVLSPPLPLLAIARSLASQPATSTPLPASWRRASSPHGGNCSVQSRGAGGSVSGSAAELGRSRQDDVSSRCAGGQESLSPEACKHAGAVGQRGGGGGAASASVCGDRSDLSALSPVVGPRVGRVSYQLVEEGGKTIRSCPASAADASSDADCAGASVSNKEYAEACCNVVPTRDWRRLLLGNSCEGGAEEKTQEEKASVGGTARSTPASSGAMTCVKSDFDKRTSTSDTDSNAELKQGFSFGERTNKSSASVARPRESPHMPLSEGVQPPLPLNGRWLTSLSWKAQLLRKVYNAGRS